MADQKLENLLNLALSATEREREKSLNLNVGYEEADNRWTLIVKYTGDIRSLESEGIIVTELYNEYAILSVPEDKIEILSQIPAIEFIEKPKRLFFAVAQGKRASCITSLQVRREGNVPLFGKGVLIAVVDSGIDYAHPDFRNEDGTSRILNLWDQTVTGAPPAGYHIGTEYTREQINLALQAQTPQERYEIVPSRDLSGHGTHVAGIAAGNGRAGSGRYTGCAPESELIIVKLGNPGTNSFPRTAELMQAVDYVIRKAIEYRMPVAVNLSFGNTYGSHDGTSLLETYLNDMATIWKSSICIGSGNEGASGGHAGGILEENKTKVIELAVAEFETALSIQIWKSYVDEVEFLLTSPSGIQVGPFNAILGTQRFRLGQTEILIYYGEPSPYSTAQEIYIDFIPAGSYIDSGIWNISLVPKRVVSGEYQLWLPSQGAVNIGTRFLVPSPDLSITIPATTQKAITVGAYDAVLNSYADFSGRGYVRSSRESKPDLVAPGVNIMSAAPGGGYTQRSGTSMATPFVTGGAALLMEWGIVNGNDAFLFGEKVKAYLQSGARPLPGFTEYPNPQLGWGALCVRDSLPV